MLALRGRLVNPVGEARRTRLEAGGEKNGALSLLKTPHALALENLALLPKDSPEHRQVEPPEQGTFALLTRVGDAHHQQYEWREAA